jgi:alpha-beta hydrolase superfamily lysophospholipase
LRTWKPGLGRVGWFAGGAAATVLVALIAGWIALAAHPLRPRPWHEFVPGEEFDADAADAPVTLDEYLDREHLLFDELDRWIAEGANDTAPQGRFNPASPAFPQGFATNWNRSFVLDAERPLGAALVLHGLSDSPYSMVPVARVLNDAGYVVVGLRLPGHGTVPGALRETEWRDWRATVRLGVAGVAALAPGAPLVVVGYSNGAALALDYTVQAIDDPELPRPDRLIFMSPALAITRMAALASTLRRLGALPGLRRLIWSDMLPEYDPYKYNSFPINAAVQIRGLTQALEHGLERLERGGRMGELPPVLTLQSAVDTTVPAISSLRRLYGRLELPGSELVVFDVNRMAQLEILLRPEVNDLVDVLKGDKKYPFDVTLVTNVDPESRAVVAMHRAPGSTTWTEEALELAWPEGIFSLAHVAIPFPPDDPIYGSEDWGDEFYPFGLFEPRGEPGMSAIPVALLMRLRYNPFFPYLEQRTHEFIAAAPQM